MSVLTELTAYTVDCIVSGELEVDTERLLDSLNRAEDVALPRATIESLDGTQRLCVRSMELDRDDLYAVEARTPRGPAGRRIHTVQHHVVMQLGPYTVMGQMHEKPGVPPLGSARVSQPMVAVTSATVVHDRAGVQQLHKADTLLINSSLVNWVRTADSQTASLFGTIDHDELDAG